MTRQWQAPEASVDMQSEIILVDACEQDLRDTVLVLKANHSDPSMFLRSESDVRKNMRDFVVAKDNCGRILGCAALHQYSPRLGEILSVAVLPEFHGLGIGRLLMEHCIQRAKAGGIDGLWLATAKPAYFRRFGFTTFSRWRLPTLVLLYKLKQTFQQPVSRWIPALLGRFTFMEKRPEDHTA